MKTRNLCLLSLLSGFLLYYSPCVNAVSYYPPEKRYVSNVIIADDNYLWCATDNGIVRWNRHDKSYEVFTPENGQYSYSVKKAALDSSGVMWFVYHPLNGGISSFDGVTWTHYTPQELPGGQVYSVAVDRNNIKWFGSEISVVSYNDTTFTLHKTGFPLVAEWIAVDRNNVKWFNELMSGNVASYDDNEWMIYNYLTTGVDISVQGPICVDLNNVKYFTPNTRYDGVTWSKVRYNSYAAAVDEQNRRWGGYSSEGITVVTDTTRIYITKEDGYPGIGAGPVFIDSQFTKWIGAGGGAFSYDGTTWTIYKLPTTNIEDRSPELFTILHNYPNPFNASTTLSFILPESGYTTLTIYNVSGQKIRELISDVFSEGGHTVHWDGCDARGLQVSSGLYFSRLEYQGKTVFGKMLMLK